MLNMQQIVLRVLRVTRPFTLPVGDSFRRPLNSQLCAYIGVTRYYLLLFIVLCTYRGTCAMARYVETRVEW